MKITREKIVQLDALTKVTAEKEEYASELLRTAQDRFNHELVKLEREGKEVELTRKVLWDEVFLLGVGCQAGAILKGLHPEVFEAFAEQERAATELIKYVKTELDIEMKKLTLSDYLNLTVATFDMLQEERKQN